MLLLTQKKFFFSLCFYGTTFVYYISDQQPVSYAELYLVFPKYFPNNDSLENCVAPFFRCVAGEFFFFFYLHEGTPK